MNLIGTLRVVLVCLTTAGTEFPGHTNRTAAKSLLFSTDRRGRLICHHDLSGAPDNIHLAAGAASNRSNCKGPIGIPCAVTPKGTRPPVWNLSYTRYALCVGQNRTFFLLRCALDEMCAISNVKMTSLRIMPPCWWREMQISDARPERPSHVDPM
jgi:hypothetical protein